MSRSRQLAAIMFTDIQGYTALMQQNEEKAIQARDKHRRIFNSTTKKYEGKILQYYGDGTLSIFDSAIAAVKCGIEMQLGFQKEPLIPVRIGIHTGDIFISEEEIIGDSVNVASRIESLAVPGSVFISDKVYDEIKNQESIKTSLLKTFKLKNIQKPIEVYAISNTGLIVPKPEDIKGKTEKDPSTVPGKEEVHQTKTPKGGAPDIILATKLYIPLPRPKAVSRPHLIGQLNEGMHRKLSLISAPAGFGKTALVSEWIASCDRPTAWLSLDEKDNEPTRFLAYFLAALQSIVPNFGEGVLRMLQSPQPPPFESILTILLNDIAAIQDRFVLVLDDYHLIEDQAIDKALAFLLAHLPPQMHMVITTREDPQLPLARLRVRGQLTELRAADLRFTPKEVATFLNEVMDLALSAEDIQSLETRTEGWIAGLQLAALSIQGRADVPGFIKAFTGDNRYIVDYLIEEVLQRQPHSVRNFLLQTSILDRLSGPLCDAVTDQEEGKALLEALERGNLFVIPLDDRRQWFRYHHLFADVLLARVLEEQPNQIPTLHARASQWYEQNGFPADAIRHALAAEDFERAASLIELAWPSMDGSFRASTWLDWAKAIPDELVRYRPVLSVAYAWAFLNGGELEAGEARLRDAEGLLGIAENTLPQLKTSSSGMVIVDEKQFQSLPASIATARAYITQAFGDIPGTLKYTQQALDLFPQEDHLGRGPAASLLGLAQWACGDLEAAHQSIADAMNNFKKAGHFVFAISGTYGLADIRIAQGRLHEAISIYEQSLQLALEQGDPVLRGTADLYLGLGDLYREQGDLKAASEYLQKSENMGEQAALPDWKYRLYIAQARLKEAQGEQDAALGLLNMAERHFYRTPIPEVRPIMALKVRLWIAEGRLPEALAWVRKRELSVDDGLNYLQEFEHITLARVLIARFKKDKTDHSISEALGLLERLLKAVEEAERRGSLIEILIQQALAHEAQGDIHSALSPLERALSLAEPEGYFRIFLDEGQPMANLLSEAAAQGIRPDYTRRLLAAKKTEEQKSESKLNLPPATFSAQPLIEPLSQRELEILHLIAQGHSNREISERLFLALSTVKGHNRNIFDKLQVQRRTEAVARARQLGLL